MSEEKPRLARLSAIITQLQSKKLVTAKEIADRHHVSVRTIYRDIRTLEMSGIPIITEEGRGYSIMKGYHLPPVMFTEEEAMALITAEQLIRKNKDKSLTDQYQSAITKIKSTLNYRNKSKTELLSNRLQVRNNPREEKTSNYLIQLQSAIANFHVLDLEYQSLNNAWSKRKIEPFALYTTKENWILIAFCRSKQEFRAFRLDCILKLIDIGETFEPHDMTLEKYLEDCRRKWEMTPDIPMSIGAITFASNQKNINMQKLQVEPFFLIGISVRTTNENNQAATDIANLWNTFMTDQLLEKIPSKIDNTIYSLYTDYVSDFTKPYTAILGCRVQSLNYIPENMMGRSFEGGTYAKMTAIGDLSQGLIVNQWTEIWKSDLPRAYTADFEVFGLKAQNPNEAEVDFYIAIN